MHGDEVVSGMHPVSELDRDVQNTFQIVLVGDVEFIGRVGDDIGLELDLAAMDSGHHLGSFDEGGWRSAVVTSDRDGECRRTGLTGFDEFGTPLPRVPEEDVIHGACGVAGRSDIDCAHEAVRSPREVRTSSTATRTWRSKASSTPGASPEWTARRT